jgi:hypothetical protein
MSSQIPPPDHAIYSVEYDGMSLRVEVRDGAVNYAEVPDVRLMTWAQAREWLVAQGYHVRRVEPAHEARRRIEA